MNLHCRNNHVWPAPLQDDGCGPTCPECGALPESGKLEYTRANYMAKECTHDQYYSQFVTPGIIQHVTWAIGKDRICASQDRHFNDIPLKEWDFLDKGIRLNLPKDKWRRLACADTLTEGGKENWLKANPNPGRFLWSLSDAVCIAKQAARIIKARNNRADSH